MSEDLNARLSAMPSSLNDACRTIEMAREEIERLTKQLVQARGALISIRSNANCHTAGLALATMPLIFDIATRASRTLTPETSP